MQYGPATDRAFHALSDPTRRRILEHLAAGEQTVNDLVGRFTISQPAITKHLGVLEGAGLIRRHKVGRQRWCRLEGPGLESAAKWLARWSGYWNTRLDRMEEFLASQPPPRS